MACGRLRAEWVGVGRKAGLVLIMVVAVLMALAIVVTYVLLLASVYKALLVAFALGLVIQLVAGDRIVPRYVSWGCAAVFGAVAVVVIRAWAAPLANVLGIALYAVLVGVLMDAGARSVTAFKDGMADSALPRGSGGGDRRDS